jgi:hypothetical protein
MPQTIKGKGLWLWTTQGKARAEKAIRADGAGDKTVKSFDTWLGTTERICKDAISKPILEKLQAPGAPMLAAGDYKTAVQKEVDATDVSFQVDSAGTVSISVSGNAVTKKKLW